MPDRKTNTKLLYLDDEANPPALASGPTITEATLSSSKYLSGVRYYSIGDTFLMALEAQNLFNIAHIDAILSADGSLMGYNNFSLNHNDASVSGVSVPPAASNNAILALTKTLDKANIYNINGKMGFTLNKPYVNVGPLWTPDENRLIHTYISNVSDRRTDYFLDEDWRLPDNDGSSYPNNYTSVPAPISGAWDSSQSLLLFTDIEGLCFNNAFIPCNHDFSSIYLPSQSINYSSMGYPQVHVRTIPHNLVPHGNGVLQLQGLVYADIQPAGNTKVEMKFPGITGWLDLGKPYNSGTFTGITGDGCHVEIEDIGSDGFGWTGGGFNTSGSGWLIMTRVSHKNISAKLITMLQLKAGSPGWE